MKEPEAVRQFRRVYDGPVPDVTVGLELPAAVLRALVAGLMFARADPAYVEHWASKASLEKLIELLAGVYNECVNSENSET